VILQRKNITYITNAIDVPQKTMRRRMGCRLKEELNEKLPLSDRNNFLKKTGLLSLTWRVGSQIAWAEFGSAGVTQGTPLVHWAMGASRRCGGAC
jgi:hypothetical protein